jgi:hypothetical protein
MNNWLIIGLLAGIAAGVLYFSASAGNFIGMMLASLASFPLFVAGLGWGAAAAAVGAGVLLVGYALLLGPASGAGAALAIGAGPVLVSWLALQNRPAAATPSAEGEVADAGIEWYPEGRLVVWMALLAAAGVALFVLVYSTGEGGFDAAMAKQLEPLFKAFAEQPNPPAPEQVEQFKSLLIAALPGGMSAVSLLSMVASLALAIAVVKRSGVSLRPWAVFGELRFPRWSVWVLSSAAIATFLPGLAGTLAWVVASAMFSAFVVLGLAVIHGLTAGNPMQPMLLGLLYMLLIFFNVVVCFPLILLAMTDQAFNLRSRSKQQPPPRT